MVRSDNGHGHRCSSHELRAILLPNTVLSVNRFLPIKHGHFHTGRARLDRAIHLVPRDLAGDDPRPDQLALLGDDSNGIRNADRNVGVYLRSALGRVGDVVCVGIVDG